MSQTVSRNGSSPAGKAQLPTLAVNGHGTVLAAHDIWFAYHRRNPVLRGVNVELRAGSLTMILGRSGSGKTTLLRVLRGLLRQEYGEVRLRPAANGQTDGQTRVAYVPQNLGLVRSMTALENTLAGALGRTGTLRSVLRIFPRQTVEEAKAILSSLGLGDKINERVYSLSGGQRQRVAIARALMQHPDVILADEFVSQLDPLTAIETLEMMREVARSGVTLLISTHETDIVAKYADQVLVMRDGAVIHDGPAPALSERAMLELLT